MTQATLTLARRRRSARRGHQGCPICGTGVVHRFRPFCSRRCQSLDLGRWLDGSYAIPTSETPATEPAAAPEATGDAMPVPPADPLEPPTQ